MNGCVVIGGEFQIHMHLQHSHLIRNDFGRPSLGADVCTMYITASICSVAHRFT